MSVLSPRTQTAIRQALKNPTPPPNTGQFLEKGGLSGDSPKAKMKVRELTEGIVRPKRQPKSSRLNTLS
jgi:hypothetical protein